MLKKLNVFVLIVFLLGQTIIGPIGSTAGLVSADDGGGADKTELEKALEAAEDALKDAEEYAEEDYTDESYGAFADAVTALESLYEATTALEDDATEDDVNTTVNKLKDAISAVGDAKDALEKELESGKGSVDDKTTNTGPSTPVTTFGAGGITTFSGTNYEDEITLTNDDIEKINFTVRDKEEFISDITTVSNGDAFELEIFFKEISNDRNFGVGTEIKYELPQSFLDSFDIGNVPGGYGGVADLELKDGWLIIKPDERVLDGTGNPKTITAGSFKMSGVFNGDNEDWDKNIIMPGGDVFTVNFVPKSGQGDTVTKNGKAYKGNTETTEKSDRIEWTVRVNTDLKSTEENPTFVDTLTASGQTSGISDSVSHVFDPATLVVKELNVSPTGAVTDGNVVYEEESGSVGVGYSTNNNVDNTKMTIDLDAGKAYEITYTTILNDPGAHESVRYENDAKYNNKPSVNDSKVITFGKAIEKSAGSGPGTDLVTNWTITYNGNEREIPANTELTDSWETELKDGSPQTAGKQVIVDADGNKVTSNFEDHITITNPKGSSAPTPDYSVSYDEDDEEFVLTFDEAFNYPIKIHYKTKPEGFTASEDFTVKNTVLHDINSVTTTETSEYKQTNLTLDKSTNGMDYHYKTMSWKITANQAGYSLNANAKFEDTFGNENMTLDEDSLEVWIGTSKYTIANNGNEFTLNNKGTDGFDITLRDGTSEQVEIIYTTDYIIKDVDKEARGKDYPNNVVLTGSGLPTEPEDSAQFDIEEEQPVNGSKTGSYNYETKEFEWKVLVNYNYDTVNSAKFTDKLPEEHAVKEIEVLKGNLTASGNFDETNADDITSDFDFDNDIKGQNEFTLELGTINQPYQITYTTVMDDGILPVEKGKNYKVTNKAKLLDENNVPNAEWSDEVEVKQSDKILDEKNGSQDGDSGIKWNFLYNTAQSSFENVVITDTFIDDEGSDIKVNQIIDKDSVKVYKAKITNSNIISEQNKKSAELIEGTDYTLEFDKNNATFVLTFDELDHAIYVEYESTFVGLEDSPISNKLKVTWGEDGSEEDSNAVEGLSFNYSSFADTQAAEFVIIKTDEATGEIMDNVEFTLKNKNGRSLLTGTTDQNGILDFEMPFAEGTYYLKEVTQPGYEPLNNYSFKLDINNHETTGPYVGKQIVNVTNTKTEDKGKMCENFTLTVKDENGEPVENKDVKLVNKKTGEVYEGTTNDDGEVTKPRADLPAGEYEVYVDGDTEDDTYINDITVKYIGENDDECNDEVQPEVVSVSGTKTWKDGNSEDRPTAITVNLFADKEDDSDNPEKTATVDSDDNWKYEFTNLPKYTKAIGEEKHEVVYTVEEVEVDGYAPTYTETENGFDITNTRTGDPVKVEVTKEWQDDNNATGERPNKITINLLQNGNVIETKEVEESDGWTYTFDNLTQYDDVGVAYEYTVTEHEVPGYAVSYDQENYEITNTRAEEKSITINKAWLDDNNPDRPNSIEVELFHSVKDGDKDSVGTYTVTAADNWSLEIQDLPSFDDNGKAYTYEIEEIEVAGYESTINGFDITNLRVGTTEVSGTKTWINKHNESEALPESITVNLLANGKEVNSVKVTAEDDWKYSFTDLPKFDENGKQITYTVTEDAVDGYKTSYDDAQLNITNTKLCEKFTVEIKDHEDKPVAEEEFTFESEDGKTTVKGKTDKDGKIVFDREDLPEGKYVVKDKDGNVIGEIVVEYSVDCADNLSIIKLDKAAVKEVSVEEGDDSKLPKTATQIFSYIALGLGLIALGITVKFTRRRKTV